MKTKDIIRYESENENTILLHINKTVCRAYEVSAYWLNSHLPLSKVHARKYHSHDVSLLFVWFHTSKLERIIDHLHERGFRPLIRSNKHIILKNENDSADMFHRWRSNIFEQIKEELPEEVETERL